MVLIEDCALAASQRNDRGLVLQAGIPTCVQMRGSGDVGSRGMLVPFTGAVVHWYLHRGTVVLHAIVYRQPLTVPHFFTRTYTTC
jgi:hypothetical protein